MEQQMLTWRHDGEHGLALDVGAWTTPVPRTLTGRLHPPFGPGVTTNPARDVLRLEAQLRGQIAELRGLLDQEVRRLDVADTAAARSARPWWSWAAKRQWRANQDEQRAAAESVQVVTDAYDEVCDLHRSLRAFVVSLDMALGPLAAAAAGWQRSPDPPDGVVVFDDEAAFLQVFPRCAVSPEWPDQLAGDVAGTAWRRDSDDDPDLVDDGGTWEVRINRQTNMVYATRRGLHVPPGMWLLSNDIPDGQAEALIVDLQPRMREPNSLPLLAETVQAAVSDQATAPAPRSADRDQRTLELPDDIDRPNEGDR